MKTILHTVSLLQTDALLDAVNGEDGSLKESDMGTVHYLFHRGEGVCVQERGFRLLVDAKVPDVSVFLYGRPPEYQHLSPDEQSSLSCWYPVTLIDANLRDCYAVW